MRKKDKERGKKIMLTFLVVEEGTDAGKIYEKK